MRFGSGHPLAYPIGVTSGTLVICLAWVPFAEVDQVSALAVVVLGIVGYTGFRLAMALGRVSDGLPRAARTVTVRRVRQQIRLVSRSWLEITEDAATSRTHWLPVYFDPRLMTLTGTTAEVTATSLRIGDQRCYPSGRASSTEPPGRLIDNPSRPDPEAPQLTVRATRLHRRLLLDAQSAVVAPFMGLLWVYVVGGGFGGFLGAASVSAATALWLAAIRGSDPS